jgi:hypothetical protein
MAVAAIVTMKGGSGLSSAEAAIIAAAVAASVTLASQFVANELTVRRDRRNQRRERLREVILQAARALYVTRSLTSEEFEELSLPPESVGAQAPLNVRATHYFAEAWSEALTELQIELGHDDPLIESYVETAAICTKGMTLFLQVRETRGVEMSTKRKAEVEASARALRNAQIARDRWAAAARVRLEVV